MRVLLVGAGGMLARDLIKSRPSDVDLVACPRAELDITDVNAVRRAIREERPQWLFNAAGMTNVDAAEQDRAGAFAVNATAVERMAQLCREHDVRLLHYSTDYVFDGAHDGCYTEDDVPRPINAYGESKLAGEEGIRRSGARQLIVRPQWLFGTGGRSFVGQMCARAIARQATSVVADQLGCCTYTVDLARVTWEMVRTGAEGLVHVANRGQISRYALAARIFEHFGASDLVAPCSSEEFGFATRRPANSALCVDRVERIVGHTMPTWSDALDRFLAERLSAQASAR